MAKLVVDNPNAGHTPNAQVEFGQIYAPASLAGSRVLLFSNNKPNVDVFHEALAARLTSDHGAAGVGRLGKLSSAFPAPPDILDKVAEYQVVVNAVGD